MKESEKKRERTRKRKRKRERDRQIDRQTDIERKKTQRHRDTEYVRKIESTIDKK